ncbi:MAG: CRISPR-associated endonuclease Cas2 [Christensenellaceae bacterium]|nr:CRISPR-associated endonuclease Cas2 [Christensenellaceae bacterium]MEA5065848.1 CRISPR-associated endonuclease Cas2 [Eubacteriales bacterium]MEA5068947.1 CRISPR-associated endonuclease Cas2 [Christensenellaceae bacterium]
MLILATYDINITTPDGQSRLRRVAKLCLVYGIRVQNSVFECRVDAAQYARLKHDIQREIDPARDSVRFYRLGENYASKVEHLGVQRGLNPDNPLIL